MFVGQLLGVLNNLELSWNYISPVSNIARSKASSFTEERKSTIARLYSPKSI
jgi:hypothetical protein